MKNIVTVGGGTGSYTVLSGLKNLKNVSLTAIVSMADSGGANALLRDELGVLPPSDVRQCLVALSEHSEIVRKLMLYRFSGGSLKGHSFGSIFLAALEKVTGDFAHGVEVASEILKVKGTVVPVTTNKSYLTISLTNGKILNGEHTIDTTNIQNLKIKKIYYKGNVELNRNAKKAILKANYIVIGPGDFYTSLIPNLIVRGFKDAIKRSKAKIILPLNLTNKKGHTLGWKASDYIRNIELYLSKQVDIILINNEKPNAKQMKIYGRKEGKGVSIEDDLNDSRVVRSQMLSESVFVNDKGDTMDRSFIRHDSRKLAKSIEKIIRNK